MNKNLQQRKKNHCSSLQKCKNTFQKSWKHWIVLSVLLILFQRSETGEILDQLADFKDSIFGGTVNRFFLNESFLIISNSW
jgi:hypothetical protein